MYVFHNVRQSLLLNKPQHAKLYWGLSTVCSCPFQASWHAEAYRYKKGGRKGKGFIKFFPVLSWREYKQALVSRNNYILVEAAPWALQKVFQPAPVKILRLQHPLNSQCFRQNISQGCKINPTPKWYIVKWLYGPYCHDYPCLATVKSVSIFSMISCQSGEWKMKLISIWIHVSSQILQRIVRKLNLLTDLF